MKTESPLLLIATFASAIAFTGCSTGSDHSQDTSGAARSGHEQHPKSSETEPVEKKPQIGMSQSQIRSMYGDPESISHTGRGETWTYFFNKWHALIPYNFGYRPRLGVFMFDARGALTEFNYNE